MKIIRISAIWCGSCIGMKNVWNEIVKTNDLDITNYDIDFDSEEVKSMMLVIYYQLLYFWMMMVMN